MTLKGGVTSILNRALLTRAGTRKPGRFAIALIWLVFTLSLLVWWIYFGFRQVDRLSELGYPDALELARFQRMLMWEGGTLISLIIGGGVAGLYLLAKELKTQGEIRSFFAAFTHELRTALSALLMKLETLRAQGVGDEVVQALTVEVERVRLQLDNALLATVSTEGGLHREPLVLVDVVRRVAERFSDLSVATVGDVQARVICDARALESMISNLLSNALVHGKAGGVTVAVERGTYFSRSELAAIPALGRSKRTIRLQFTDDGLGFVGDRELLGQKFARHYAGSGAGLGLAITTELAQRSGGAFRYEIVPDNRFIAVLVLPEAL